MRQFLICSTCGLTSGRRWNLERHIDARHDGAGKPMAMMEYVIAVQSGLTPYPSYNRPNALPSIAEEKKNESLASLLLDHALRSQQIEVPRIRSIIATATRPIALSIAVCEQCLTYKIRCGTSSKTSGISESTIHTCQHDWLLDNPKISEHSELAISVLCDHQYRHLASLLRQLNDGIVELFATRLPYTPIIDAKKAVNNTIAESLIRKTTNVADLVLAAAALESAAKSGSTKEKECPELCIHEETWILPACGIGRIELDEQELIRFLSIANCTVLKAKVHGALYHFMIPVVC